MGGRGGRRGGKEVLGTQSETLAAMAPCLEGAGLLSRSGRDLELDVFVGGGEGE